MSRLVRLASALSGVLVACGGGGGPASPVNPAPGECTGGCDPGYLDPHNQVRAGTLAGVTVTPTPAPALPPLEWSQAAADIARAWANGCTFGHNPNRGADGTPRGENVYADASSGSPSSAHPGSVAVLAWAAEWSSYTYASNTCAGTCGHYTQLVWRDTLRVGCASATCTTNSPFGAAFPTWRFVVCDYEPPGNFVGQRPY